jgi:hypothetical protein
LNFWIEVTGGDNRWLEKLRNENKRGLIAPESTRYEKMFKNIREGDYIFTYLTKTPTITKEWKSSIVGISTASTTMYEEKGSLKIKTNKDTQLNTPIPYSIFSKMAQFSENFKKNIRRGMQRYIIEITQSDYISLIEMYEENINQLCEKEYLTSI